MGTTVHVGPLMVRRRSGLCDQSLLIPNVLALVYLRFPIPYFVYVVCSSWSLILCMSLSAYSATVLKRILEYVVIFIRGFK
jgi:hypothetical protein